MRQTGDIHRKLASTEFPGKTAHAPMFKEYALNLSWVAVVMLLGKREPIKPSFVFSLEFYPNLTQIRICDFILLI